MKSTNKIIFFISLVIFSLLLYFSFFNSFQSDDFWYAQSKHIGVLNHAKKLYFTQGGRYFSYSLNAAIPIDWQIFPKVYPIFLILLFITSLVLNFRLFFGYNYEKAIYKSMLFFFIYETLLFSISEHFYWYSGINVYFLPIIISSYFLYFYKKYSISYNKLHLIIFIVLSFFIAGSNEILVIVFYTFLLLDCVMNKKKWKLYILFLVSFLLLFNVLAPGNFVRLSKVGEQNNIVRIFLLRIYIYLMNGIWIFLKSCIILPLILFFFKEEFQKLREVISFKKSFILLLPSFFSLLFIGFITFIQGRANDTILIVFAFVLTFIISYKIIPNRYFVVLSLVVVFLPKVYLFPKRDNLFMINYNNFDILSEILFTDLKGFNKEVKQRRTTLETSKEKTILLEPIYNRPRVLYFEEMGRLERPNYINDHLKHYYHKTVAVKYRYDNK